MKGTWVLVLLVVTSTAGAAIQADGSDCPVEIGQGDGPGQELANVIGAQESVVAREIERRGFNATLANASTPDERATVVATEIERIEYRLATTEACRDALVAAHEDDDLTAEEYRERALTLEPEIVDARESLDRAAAAASDLPPSVRSASDIGDERFEELADRITALETWADRPDRVFESVDSDEPESTPADSTPEESTVSEPPVDRTPTTDTDSDTPEETTVPSTETPTETPTADPTPTTETPPAEPDPTPEPSTTTPPPDDEAETDDEDGADEDDEAGEVGGAGESEGDWPL